MSAGVGTAKPRATRIGDSIVLVGGRPGNIAWLNPKGDGGDTWIKQEMPAPKSCEVKLTKKLCNTCTCMLVRHAVGFPSTLALRRSLFGRLAPRRSMRREAPM
eukprot:COSAG02_NODE_36609_length_452_cov_1.405099_1_plen_102_part_10